MPCYPPDRWIDYAPLGVPVKGTRFLPIKLPIPLEKSYNIPPHLRWNNCCPLYTWRKSNGLLHMQISHRFYERKS
uniref:Dual specificity phosphatase 11 (RNA/RNP complex 1-interacting) n=1 Tax=Schistosoma japonicum TaxID=6182 RepID=C1LIW0_SCHJA|nr:dual specificity phosphatase 11 (RNA/RNP complex 1-interacting) [Schistosoma japonicum]